MKRCLDVLFAFCLLILVLPVLLFCALVIKLESRGPVIFRQPRMGRGFRPFLICKFRTMRHKCKGSPITLGEDTRVTRFGGWMRRHKLDELPQLWNVLCGDMSLVGPRPVIPSITEEFCGEYRQLLAVRPGLTDPAALAYYHECDLLNSVPDPLRYFREVVTPDKLRRSVEYLERATLWSDLIVIAQTILAVGLHLSIGWESGLLMQAFPSLQIVRFGPGACPLILRSPRREPIFSSSRREERRISGIFERRATKKSGKSAPSRRVAAKIRSCFVVVLALESPKSSSSASSERIFVRNAGASELEDTP